MNFWALQYYTRPQPVLGGRISQDRNLVANHRNIACDNGNSRALIQFSEEGPTYLTYLRSTMKNDRLNGLASISIERGVRVNPEEVLYELALNPRKLDLVL